MCEAQVFFLNIGCVKPRCFLNVKCGPSVYMPSNALSDSFTEGSFIYSLPLHYINITLLTAFQMNFPIFAFYKMSKRQVYDVKLIADKSSNREAGRQFCIH